MPRPAALLISPATIPSPHEPPISRFCPPFISHPLPSAQPPFPPSLSVVSPLSTVFLPRAKPRGTPTRAVSPLSAAFTPNRPLTPLSTAFTKTHRGCGGPQSPITAHRHAPAMRPSQVLSYSCRLFVVRKKLNPFAIKQIHALSAKHPGGGGGVDGDCV